MSKFMRAKMIVNEVRRFAGGDAITCAAVGPKGSYPADGSDEDNTYAKFSPQGALTLTIVNTGPDRKDRARPEVLPRLHEGRVDAKPLRPAASVM